MSGLWATFSREVKAFFYAPLAYVLLFAVLITNGYVFLLIVSYLNDPRSGGGRPLDLFFGGTWLFWVVQLFIGAILTMRLISEERKSGSLELLMTAPVKEEEVILGKYLAALTFFVFLWLPTLGYALLIEAYSEVDWGTVAAGYLGILGIGALFLAIGLLCSALARNQVVAAMVTFALTFIFFLCIGFLEGLVNDPGLKDALGYLNVLQHMADFGRGIIDTRRVVYYLSMIAFLLFLSSRALEAKKWR